MTARKNLNAFLAFLLAPWVVPFVTLIPFPGQDRTAVVNPASGLQAVLLFGVFALPTAYIAEILLGIPAWIIFQHYRLRSSTAFTVAGVLIGLVFYFTIEILQYVFSPYSRQLRQQFHISFNPFSDPYFYISTVGAMTSALLFRIILFWGNYFEAES